MRSMREILRESIGTSLQSFCEADRVASAWAVACGPVLAGKGSMKEFAGGVMRVEVAENAWLREFVSVQSDLKEEISQIANVKVDAIHFELKRFPKNTLHEQTE